MTKTETLRRNLLASGYERIEHASADPAFRARVMRKSTGKVEDHTVFLLTGTLRGCWSGKRTEAITLPRLTLALMAGPVTLRTKAAPMPAEAACAAC